MKIYLFFQKNYVFSFGGEESISLHKIGTGKLYKLEGLVPLPSS